MTGGNIFYNNIIIFSNILTFLCKTLKPTKKSQYLMKYYRFFVLRPGVGWKMLADNNAS